MRAAPRSDHLAPSADSRRRLAELPKAVSLENHHDLATHHNIGSGIDHGLPPFERYVVVVAMKRAPIDAYLCSEGVQLV